MFLNQMGLHGDEKVTRCTVGCFHLPHEVLHAELYRKINMNHFKLAFLLKPAAAAAHL